MVALFREPSFEALRRYRRLIPLRLRRNKVILYNTFHSVQSLIVRLCKFETLCLKHIIKRLLVFVIALTKISR
jgi:predicted CDP-diglyceride synthetase/phosphatidate cytidylyltransferase